jgi:hypothetical protein
VTAEPRPTRSEYIGSGDIAAIVGCDERRNSGDVWLSKTGHLPEIETTTDINRGVALEPYVLSLFEAEHGVKLARNVFVRSDDGICAASLDGAMLGDELDLAGALRRGQDKIKPMIEVFNRPRNVLAPVEAKTTNMGRAWDRETGEIPINVLVQVQFQIYCSGPQCHHGFVPALISEFQRFKFLSPVPIVRRDDELIEQLVISAHEFMDHVRRGQRPADAVPHLESLKRIRREPDSVIVLGDDAAELWASFEAAKEKAKGAERDVEEYKRQVLDLLGTEKDGVWCGVEAGKLPDGREIRFMEQNGPRNCDLDQLQVLSPDLYDRTVSQSRFRVLRIKRAIKGKR